MNTRQDLVNGVLVATVALQVAKKALADFDSLPENNVFESMELAEARIQNVLLREAKNDCEGANNCGVDEYRRKFMVDGIVYEGILRCEYDRHDKTYYYIDRHEFEVVEIKQDLSPTGA